jgi:hypothetical protein
LCNRVLQGDNDAALVEFIGHMPIIGIALLLLLLGYGQRLKITNLWTVESSEITKKTSAAEFEKTRARIR